MSDSTSADDEVESKLAGTTRRVYGCILESSGLQCGVRDIARKLKIKHPSVVLYHLQKLEELGLVDHTNTGVYYLVKEVRVGVLKLFFRLRGLLFPRLLIYSLFISVMVGVYFGLFAPWMIMGASIWDPGILVMFATSLIIAFIACGFLWFETIMTWREKRF